MDLRWLAVLWIACSSAQPIVSKPAVVAKHATSRTLVLTVRDATGPLAGAAVTWGVGHATRTDGAGHATASGLETIQNIKIRAAGHETKEFLLDNDDPLAMIERTVTLGPGARIDGIVLDPDGQPAADALVHLDVSGGELHETADSDAGGHWSIDGIAAGHHAVSAFAPGFATWPPKQIIESDGVHTLTGVVVRLSAGATITGTVVDRTGAEVANAKINCDSDEEVADAHGRFTVGALIAGDHTLYAVSGTAVSAARTVVVAENGHATLELVVEGTSTISGTVTDADGHPVDATIVASQNDRSVVVSGRADKAGRFTLVAPPGTYRIDAQSDDGRSPRSDVKSGGRVDLVISRRPTITGRVIADGKPVPYFGINLQSYIPRAVRAADGRFVLHDFWPGTYTFVIVAPGFVPYVRAGVVGGAGATVNLGDIVLDRGRELHGRVVDVRGRGVANATVQLSLDADFTPPTTLDDLRHGHVAVQTSATGRYLITGIDPARDRDARIEARDGDLRSIRRLLARGDDEVELKLGATGEIDGEIASPPPTTTHLRVIATAASSKAITYETPVSTGGDFHFDHLPAGTYEVAVDGRPSARVTVVAGQHVKVTVAAPRDPQRP